MKYIFYRVFFLFLMIMFSKQTYAQITLTKTDLDGSVLNTTRTTYGFGDSLTVNLGSASGSSQSFDFSGVSKGDPSNRDTAVFDYVSSAGQWKADSFPGANACGRSIGTVVLGPYTITLSVYIYVSTENDGVFGLGASIRQQVTPDPSPFLPPDTTYYSRYRPWSLQVPLPLTIGTQRTTNDTLFDFEGTEDVTARTYDANGFGSVTFPDGRTMQAIRMVEDRVELKYTGGVFDSRTRSRHIRFVGQDYTLISFEVDTNYSGGSTLATSYEFETQGTPVGVKESPTGIAETFSLSQNYPNPFNPTTTITFYLPEEEHAVLKLSDMMGKEVATLVEGRLSSGTHRVVFDAGKLSSGMYMYRLTAGRISKSMKLMIVK